MKSQIRMFLSKARYYILFPGIYGAAVVAWLIMTWLRWECATDIPLPFSEVRVVTERILEA
jgi:hypothetical protein